MALQQDFRVKRGLVVSEAANVVGNAAVTGKLTVSNTAALGNTTITGFINVSSTAALGSTTVSGFANVSGIVNAAAFTIGTSLVANSTSVLLGGLTSLNSSSVGVYDGSNSTVVTIQPSIFLGGTQWLTGTVTTNGTTTVAGTGTLFLTELQVGDGIRVTGNETVYTVSSIASDTSLTVSFAIPTATSKTFQRTPTASISGNTTVLKGTLAVYNAVNFNRSANVGSTLGVQGATTLSNTLVVSGAATLSNTVNIAGAANLSSTINVSGAASFNNNVTISGNLIVSGTTTYVNTATLNVSDNIVTLNADVPAITAPTENAGIEVNRGSAANSSLLWDETNDRWTATGNTSLTGAIAEIHIGGTGAANLAVDNAGGTVIQDLAVNVDSFGHLRTITSTSANLDARYLTFSNIVAGNSSQANVVADLYNDTLTLANSTGIDITTNASTDTITFTHSDTSSQANVSITNTNGSVLQGITLNVDGFGHVVNAVTSSVDLDNRYTRTAFANIAVSGQSTIVADTIADTLTLVGAGSVSITTDASTDTITITGAATTGTLTTVANTSVNQGLVRLSAGGANSDATVVGGGSVVVSSNSTAVLVNGLILDSVANTSTVYAATANSVKTAYDRAGTAYSNATSYADTIAGTAYSNATSYADTIAGTAYSNATSFAANANNLSSGTVAVARGGTGTGNFATAGLAYVSGTAAFATATAAQIVSAIGTTKVANATYADSAGSAGSATTAGAVTNGVYTTGDQTIGGNKTFSATLGVAGQTAFGTGNWTTGGWKRGISMSTPYTIWWAKGTSDVSKGIGATDDNLIRFIASTADSGAAETYPFQFDMSGGALTATGNVTAYSDIKLKTDLARITDALEKVQQLTGYTYTRIDSGQRQTGLIAQDVQKVLPEAVIESPGTDTLALAYGNLVGLLVEAIKELKQEVDDLRSKLQ